MNLAQLAHQLVAQHHERLAAGMEIRFASRHHIDSALYAADFKDILHDFLQAVEIRIVAAHGQHHLFAFLGQLSQGQLLWQIDLVDLEDLHILILVLQIGCHDLQRVGNQRCAHIGRVVT